MFTVVIAGRLGRKPNTRFTPSGQKVTDFSVATSHRKGKEEITIWVRVVVWGDRFDKILPYLDKGSAVVITGRMNPPSTYTDKEGHTQISLEVTAEMIEFSPFGKGQSEQKSETSFEYSASQSPSSTHSSSQHERQSPFAGQTAGLGDQFSEMKDEDDLPF